MSYMGQGQHQLVGKYAPAGLYEVEDGGDERGALFARHRLQYQLNLYNRLYMLLCMGLGLGLGRR